ncbi:unnamed protein product [Ectocarpus fasciculatus]
MCARASVSALIPHVILMHLEAKAITPSMLLLRSVWGASFGGPARARQKGENKQALNPFRRAATNNAFRRKRHATAPRASQLRSQLSQDFNTSPSTVIISRTGSLSVFVFVFPNKILKHIPHIIDHE